MAEDQRQAEDEPVTLDTPMEVDPGVFKRLGDCTEEDVLRAALLRMARVEGEMQQDVDQITADPDE